MKIFLIIIGYLHWHIGLAIQSLSNIWKNFLFFIWEFFSLKLLIKNFFDPWKRMTDTYPKNLDLKKYFYAFLTNLIVRSIGIIMRTGLIVLGFFCLGVTSLLYPIALIGWLLLPLISLFLLGNGLWLIIK